MNTSSSLSSQVENLENEIKAHKIAFQQCKEYNAKTKAKIEILENELKQAFELEDKINEINNEKEIATTSYLELATKHDKIAENLEITKNDKEVLASSLEEIHERLVNERTCSEQLSKNYITEVENINEIKEKLSQEMLINERLSEQIHNEQLCLGKLKEELLKIQDLDTVLERTLKSSHAEGSIVRTEKGFLFNNTIINLILHNETFIVVRSDNDMIPLIDFLNNSILPTPATKHPLHNERKTENRSMDSKDADKSKSPIRCIGGLTKNQKTPLRDRNSSSFERKKQFK